MIEKIRSLTSCVSPGGGGYDITWNCIKKRTRNKDMVLHGRI